MKGAVLLLEDGKREGLQEETSPIKQGVDASSTRHRHLHAMFELLRPEDTIKLVRPLIYTHVVGSDQLLSKNKPVGDSLNNQDPLFVNPPLSLCVKTFLNS